MLIILTIGIRFLRNRQFFKVFELRFYFSPLFSNSFLPKEKGEQNSFSHREKVDCDEVARRMRASPQAKESNATHEFSLGEKTLYCPEINFEVKNQKMMIKIIIIQ